MHVLLGGVFRSDSHRNDEYVKRNYRPSKDDCLWGDKILQVGVNNKYTSLYNGKIQKMIIIVYALFLLSYSSADNKLSAYRCLHADDPRYRYT